MQLSISNLWRESLLISAIDKLEDEIDGGTRMHGAILGFSSFCADPDIDQAVGQSSGEILLQICLLYTDNVDNIDMWEGRKSCQTILGLVSKLLHPLSVLLTIVLLWVLVPCSCWCVLDCTKIHLIGNLLKLTWSKQCRGVCACTVHVTYLRHIREEEMFDLKA